MPDEGRQPRQAASAAQVAAHELNHDAQAAVQITGQLAVAHQQGDTRRTSELIERLGRALERLHRDIGTLLSEPDGDLNTLHRAPVRIGELINRVVQAHPAGQHDIHVEVAGAVMINADAVKLERILDNLLDNALEHTPPESPIYVQASVIGGGAEIVIEDRGPGLSEDLARHIFQPGEDPPPPAEGTGMGLWIAGRFTRLHGGHLSVEPGRHGHGARFRVWLPARPPTP